MLYQYYFSNLLNCACDRKVFLISQFMNFNTKLSKESFGMDDGQCCQTGKFIFLPNPQTVSYFKQKLPYRTSTLSLVTIMNKKDKSNQIVPLTVKCCVDGCTKDLGPTKSNSITGNTMVNIYICVR